MLDIIQDLNYFYMIGETVKFCFLLFNKTHILDLAGPVQVIYEASKIGKLNIEIVYTSVTDTCCTEQGLKLCELKDPTDITLSKNDFLVIPGIEFQSFVDGEMDDEIHEYASWIKLQKAKGVKIASICSGALILAEVGILDGIACTSHWKCTDYIQSKYPKTKVQTDKIFVCHKNIYTSAGMTSGIDMFLSIIEELFNPLLTAKVSHEMVIFMRRDKNHSQESVYLDYHGHSNSAIHKVQSYIISQPEKNIPLSQIADIANMSIRNFTRTFKRETGRTITEFKHQVKIELVKSYLKNPDLTIEMVASKCGFSSPRQLNRIWSGFMDISIKEFRKSKE